MLLSLTEICSDRIILVRRLNRTIFFYSVSITLVCYSIARCEAAAAIPAFIGTNRLLRSSQRRNLKDSSYDRRCWDTKSYAASNDEKNLVDALDTSFPDHLIRSLDLAQLLRGVAQHAGRFAGYQALLSLVNQDQESLQTSLFGSQRAQGASARRRRATLATTDTPSRSPQQQHREARSGIPLTTIACSAEEARQEYETVEQAMLALQNQENNNLTFPPIYGAESSPWDTTNTVNSDDDEWLTLPADVWTLEHIIQAEQVIDTLIHVKEWASRDETNLWTPKLAQMGLHIDGDDLLPRILDDITETVEIVRVRSLVDPNGKATYTFRLKGDKFPVLKILQDEEEKLLQNGGKALDRAVMEIQNEIDEVQFQIRIGLAQTVLSMSSVIEQGLDAVTRLDVIFAKAAFGAKLNGAIPHVASDGMISVHGFVHPVLAAADGSSIEAKPGESGHVVAIDLKLSSQQGDRALIVSGPNGGGKTLSMKSFGLVCVMSKLGLPIPRSQSDEGQPRVDFFDHILVNVGDQQSVIDGESTWTATLKTCASMIEAVGEEKSDRITENKESAKYLVLLDELGSGTDPEAGGAIAQAILEQFLTTSSCHVVATTHSPRLKTLSYDSPDFACATVLLETDDSKEYQRPSFRLEYGLIGESYALGAASRCVPALPESVLVRASNLMTQSSDNDSAASGSDYLRALTRSMEDQEKWAKEKRTAMEQSAQDVADCRRAMMSLAASYENQFARLEQRLEDGYQKLSSQGQELGALELVGETLTELRVVKKQIQSQQEVLREQGLKLLPTSYRLQAGESVVIVASGEWDGSTVKVIADATMNDENKLGPSEVLVQPSSSSSFLGAWDNDMFMIEDFPGFGDVAMSKEDQSLIVQRHELAIWDYSSVWEEEDNTNGYVSATSVPDCKRRLSSLLSTLKNDPSKTATATTTVTTTTSSGRSTSASNGSSSTKASAFTSSRQRKAANRSKGKKKRK